MPPPLSPNHACSFSPTQPSQTLLWTHTKQHGWSGTHTHTNTNLLLDIFKPRLVLLSWQPPQTHHHSNPTSAFQAPNPGGLQGPSHWKVGGCTLFRHPCHPTAFGGMVANLDRVQGPGPPETHTTLEKNRCSPPVSATLYAGAHWHAGGLHTGHTCVCNFHAG